MPRKFFKRISPNPEKLTKYQSLGWLSKLMHDTQLWGFKRTSVAKGCAIGLFCCMIPMPLQMLLAASIALVWKANIPLSVALVWVSNPLTMAPILYANYKFGSWILQTPAYQLDLEWSQQKQSLDLTAVVLVTPKFVVHCGDLNYLWVHPSASMLVH